MTEAPDPLVPPHVDLRDLDGFMLNVERLLASELWALSASCPEAFRSAVGLWARAWKQLPAASLPSDETTLAAFAGMPLAKLKKLWPLVMRGFVLCNDGRYYHRVLAPEAVGAWERKLAYKARRDADKKRLDEWRRKQRETRDETADETRFVAEDTGQGQGHSSSLRSEESPSLRSGGATSSHGSRLSVEWELPDEWRCWAVENTDLTPGQIRGQADRFKDHWLGKAGAAGRHADWFATWRNWCRKSKEMGSGSNRAAQSRGGTVLGAFLPDLEAP